MINLGNIEIADLRLGLSQVKAAYLGSEQIWGGEEPAPVGDWLCFTAVQNNSTVNLAKVNNPPAVSLETSTDGETWADYTINSTLTLDSIGDKVYFRAKTENQTIGSSASNYYKFVMTGQIAASGNIQTLLKADGSRTDVPAHCYQNMFNNCTALTTAPDLPATTLSESCYQQLFAGCSSLTTAPILSATTVYDWCCWRMFYNCTSLTDAPSLPATTLSSGCYQQMFNGCTSLSAVDVAFTDWSLGDATNNWLNNVAASGTFTCPAALGDDSTITRGTSNCPTGWTVVNT